MILSVSRRTDVPNYYSEWFFNRIKAGFVYVRNPINANQVFKIDINPEAVDCIAFWTKNPKPMIGGLDALAAYKYYFQFTLTAYEKDAEPNVPPKNEAITIFQELSKKIGSKKVIWRYDPIFFSKKYTPEYHLEAFDLTAARLKEYTEKCVISFVDIYAKNKKNMEALGAYEPRETELIEFVNKMSAAAKENGIEIKACAEKTDFSVCGAARNSCIDKALIENIIGRAINARKDKNQRKECGCAESADVGAYNTCKNACKYCYANGSEKTAAENFKKYDPDSPILCGELSAGDEIILKKSKSLKKPRQNVFDL